MIDIATLVGIVGGLALIAAGILITPGSSVGLFFDPASLMITVGGANHRVEVVLTNEEVRRK
ncbi:MAG: hypothetical protein HYY17_09190 [Planctomycetes bacterium]|nr:hypothetical protein [Planctomycetota bacterium]